jgi:hypothetical protein
MLLAVKDIILHTFYLFVIHTARFAPDHLTNGLATS